LSWSIKANSYWLWGRCASLGRRSEPDRGQRNGAATRTGASRSGCSASPPASVSAQPSRESQRTGSTCSTAPPRPASASSVADTVAWARWFLRRYGELFPEDPSDPGAGGRDPPLTAPPPGPTREVADADLKAGLGSRWTRHARRSPPRGFTTWTWNLPVAACEPTIAGRGQEHRPSPRPRPRGPRRRLPQAAACAARAAGAFDVLAAGERPEDAGLELERRLLGRREQQKLVTDKGALGDELAASLAAAFGEAPHLAPPRRRCRAPARGLRTSHLGGHRDITSCERSFNMAERVRVFTVPSGNRPAR
jgi:hypothetical protein